jgi:hypothetical protein
MIFSHITWCSRSRPNWEYCQGCYTQLGLASMDYATSFKYPLCLDYIYALLPLILKLLAID